MITCCAYRCNQRSDRQTCKFSRLSQTNERASVVQVCSYQFCSSAFVPYEVIVLVSQHSVSVPPVTDNIYRSAVPAPNHLPERRSAAFRHHYSPVPSVADDFAAKHNLQLLQFVSATKDKVRTGKGNTAT